ncbi:MAG: OmpA family protein [Deltaproteobacteria bacterium]|nr:OmpA family protein [Deltaproteobacteria bacterium]
MRSSRRAAWFFFPALLLCVCLSAPPAHAAYVSRFEVNTFEPAVDSGQYYTQYSSQNLKAWQGTLGFYFDYANRPLQFVGIDDPDERQSVIDQWIIANFYGALGFTDWFEAGINVPVALYNWFFTDIAGAPEDHGMGMGDVTLMTKFRVVNTENSRVGFAVMPYVMFPTGDGVRYLSNGSVAAGLRLITDFILHERFNMTLNVGYFARDDVTLHAVRMDDSFTYGLAGNVDFGKGWHGIAEIFGTTVIRDFFSESSSSPLEAGGGIRYLFGGTGFALDVGANAGIIDGVGAPRVRGYLGLKWTSPVTEECPECPPPAPPPDPRIRDGKIVIWGKIYFDTDKAVLKPLSFPVLDDVVDVMQKNAGVRMVEIQGHCDWRASDAYNMDLSQRRADAVKNYLTGKGIEASRLTAKGYGESKPIADNKTVEGMAQNRRVEFVIQQQDF